MARPVYSYELSDPDFQWLLETFQEHRSNYLLIEENCLPLVLIEAPPARPGAALLPDEFVADSPFESLIRNDADTDSSFEEK